MVAGPAEVELRSKLGPPQDQEPYQLGGLVLLVPAVLLLLALFIAPVLFAFYLAFTKLTLVGPDAQSFQFTGAHNFQRMLGDSVFRQSLVLTLTFLVAATIGAQSAIALALALLMQRAQRAVRLVVSGIAIVAWVIPDVTAGIAWYAFAQAGGTLGLLLRRPGEDFLTTWPFLIVCIALVWHNVAFSMLIFSAGLRNVPDELLEAAEMEGADYPTRLRSVTLPILQPTIITNFLLSILQNLSAFTLIYVMTQGGPNNATMTLPVYAYQQAFEYDQLGYGTAIAAVLLLVGAVFGVFFVRRLRLEAE